jgi:Flp pilus assembly protein TadB
MSDRMEHGGSSGDDLKEHIKSRSTWLRLVFMLLFVFIFYISQMVLFAAAALQFLWKLFTGEVNERLTAFGANLAEFIRQIARFLTFNTEHMPFPFSDWPGVGGMID